MIEIEDVSEILMLYKYDGGAITRPSKPPSSSAQFPVQLEPKTSPQPQQLKDTTIEKIPLSFSRTEHRYCRATNVGNPQGYQLFIIVHRSVPLLCVNSLDE